MSGNENPVLPSAGITENSEPQVIGTYSSGSPVMSVPSSIFKEPFEHATLQVYSLEVNFESAFIFDSPEEESVPYLVLAGHENETGHSFVIGIEILRASGNYLMDPPSSFDRAHWKCSGSPCSSCSPERGRFGGVTGCVCNSVGFCNHESSGGFLLWLEAVWPF